MSVEFEQEIAWDGSRLSVWARRGMDRVLCLVPRDAIHCIHIYNDAIGREIERDRLDIFERLRPVLISKIRRGETISVGPFQTIELRPQDVGGAREKPLDANAKISI